ncbi:MAG: trypsin-like serine protease [Methanosarcinales archaeon]|nr:trypsin-like serine protease [Methanosarcinales archaeon]
MRFLSPPGFFVFLTLCILILSGAGAAQSVTPEKRVGYTYSPAVVMIKSEFIGDLVNDDGESMIYLSIYNGTEDYPMKIPQFSTGGLGSGFIISNDGYIVTNAHVVEKTEEEIRADYALQAVAWAIEEFPPIFAASGDDPYPETVEDVQELYEQFLSYDLDYVTEIRVYFGNPGRSAEQAGHQAEVRKISPQKIWMGSADHKYRSGKDLAIIKIEGFSQLPTVRLGDSSRVEVGDKVIAIGFPGLTMSWENVVLSRETDYVPTVTSGIISAKKKLPDGSDVFQTDAAIYHGNSGGPAFNEDGEVVGITTFGSGKYLSSGEWMDVLGYDFLIPINVAKSFIQELNINTTVSAASGHFQRGLESYWSKNYTAAEEEFGKIYSLDPNNAYAGEYARMARLR